MQAAYPYIDDFLPAGTVASLERLGEVLAGVAGERPAPDGEAAAAADAARGERHAAIRCRRMPAACAERRR